VKVEVLENVYFPLGNVIEKGEILKVIETNFLGTPSYKVVEGKFTDCILRINNAVKIDEEIYTEKQWNDMENYYMSELDKVRAAKERAQELVKGLTETLKHKNNQIDTLDSCVNVLAFIVKYSAEAIEKIKNLEKAQ
jgi:hypothetical protein